MSNYELTGEADKPSALRGEQSSAACLSAEAWSCSSQAAGGGGRLSARADGLVSAREGESANLAASAGGDSSKGLWLQFGGFSHHMDRSRNFNEHNFGLGAQYRFNENHAVSVGYYHNSIRQTSHYALYKYTPLHYGPVSAGVMAGAVDGYPKLNHGRAYPLALPMASVRMGRVEAEAMYVPKMKDISSVVALNFGYKF